MKTAAVIAEYNPFHKGHQYHLEQARALTGADQLIVIMSGHFVQRGTPACMDKFTRTRLALSAGADLVLELPLCYAVSSAEDFAGGAVRSLESLGMADYLVFGCETPDLALLRQMAEYAAEESDLFRSELTGCLSRGMTYPAAYSRALSLCFPETLRPQAERLLAGPNNLLAFSYLKALYQCSGSMEPVPVLRTGSGYHDLSLQEEAPVSASALRQLMESETAELSAFLPHIPPDHHRLWTERWRKTFPILPDSLSPFLFQKLLEEDASSLTSYADVTKDLANRICRHLDGYTSFIGFAASLKSRQYTLLRIQRSLLHILLEIRSVPPVPPYIRVLGFRSPEILSLLHRSCSLPVLTRLASAESILPPGAAEQFRLEMRAASLYRYLVRSAYGFSLPKEYEQGLITGHRFQ